MAKKLLALLLVLILVASLIGCGEKKIDTTAWKDMEITVGGYRNFQEDPKAPGIRIAADKFTETYGTKINFMAAGGDGLGDDIVAAMVAGDPWEIQFVWGISVLPLAFNEDIYTPITEYVDFKDERIDKESMDATLWKGDYYGISAVPMQEIYYIAYNETWMKELGIKTPYEYYEDGEWNWESYKIICEEAVKAGYGTRSEIRRPHTGRKYMSKWDLDKGRVEVTYDCAENYEWLNFWAELITNPKYNYLQPGSISGRSIMMRDNVMPEIMQYEVDHASNDRIRYINFPEKDGSVSSYMTDGHFMFPRGNSEEKLQCSIELAKWMSDEQSKYMDGFYRENMCEEDYAIWQKTLDNITFLPGAFYEGVFTIGETFINDMKAGKAVATHIAENTESLKAKAEEYNEKYAK